jgi:hypothetical protein
MQALAIVAAAALLGCGKLRSWKGDGDAGTNATSTAAASAAPAPPCLAGKWDAKDLSSRIKSAVKSAKNAGLTPAGGKIAYEFSPPSPDGKGVVIVTVTNFVTKLTAGEGGLKVNGTITLGGPAKMPYTVGPEDALTIAAPIEGKINAHADVRTSGIVNTRNTEDSVVDLSGAFVSECSGDTLQMWKRSGSGKQGAPLVFARIK